jgi:hypothetical protein
MTRDPDSPYYTRREAAHYCRVSVKTIDRWTSTGRLAKHSEEPVRFHRDALDFALAHNTPDGPAGNLMEPQTDALMGTWQVNERAHPELRISPQGEGETREEWKARTFAERYGTTASPTAEPKFSYAYAIAVAGVLHKIINDTTTTELRPAGGAQFRVGSSRKRGRGNAPFAWWEEEPFTDY